MLTREFKKGQRVRYIPTPMGDGDRRHPDVEYGCYGCVRSTNDEYVFVLFDFAACTMVTGDEQYNTQATSPNDLEVQ